jgi:flagellar motor switch protein FliG
MSGTEFVEIIEKLNQLDDNDKEYVRDILTKQLVESKRDTLIQRVNEAEVNYTTGKVSSGNADELLAELEDD